MATAAPPVHVRWLTAFVDLPAVHFDVGAQFWQDVTRSDRSAPRGDDGEFATLIPPDGDPYLRVQRTDEGPRIHLDLHVDSVDDARRQAEALGARHCDPSVERGHAIMTSPTGMTFCFVDYHGEAARTLPGPSGVEHRLDQVCIDVPDDRFDRETSFWSDLTAWDLNQSRLAEFAVLSQPPTSPIRLLFQRLGADDGAETSRAHLDLACGEHVDAVRAEHERLGATFVHPGTVWTTMRDPAGLPYCLTRRDPDSGLVQS